MSILTLPKLFKKAGYNTSVVGKWHLGIGKKGTPVDWNSEVKPGPLEVGFDYSFLLPSTNDRVPCVYVENYKVVNLDPKDPLYVGKAPEGHKSTVYPDGKKDRSAMTYYQSTHGHNNSVINGIGRIGYMWGGKSALWNDETMSDEFVIQAKKYMKKAAKEDICCCVTFCEFVAAAKKLCDKTCNIACEVLKRPLKDSLCKFHATAKFNGRARAML